MRASDTSEVIFSDCRVPEENMLGAEGEGFIGSLKILDGGRISIAALALGMAQGALEAATNMQAAETVWAPISEFQRFSCLAYFVAASSAPAPSPAPAPRSIRPPSRIFRLPINPSPSAPSMFLPAPGNR